MVKEEIREIARREMLPDQHEKSANYENGRGLIQRLIAARHKGQSLRRKRTAAARKKREEEE